MAISAIPETDLKADINVTPLVDVMLVLLVILLVVAPMLRQQVPVELPLAEHGQQSSAPDQVTLAVTADGALLLHHERVAEDTLPTRLHDLYMGRADKTILLEADGSLLYSRVVRLMDLCRAAGVERIGVVTQKSKEPASAS
jgi:biopolymer transport protein ExbD